MDRARVQVGEVIAKGGALCVKVRRVLQTVLHTYPMLDLPTLEHLLQSCQHECTNKHSLLNMEQFSVAMQVNRGPAVCTSSLPQQFAPAVCPSSLPQQVAMVAVARPYVAAANRSKSLSPGHRSESSRRWARR